MKVVYNSIRTIKKIEIMRKPVKYDDVEIIIQDGIMFGDAVLNKFFI